MKKRRRHIRRRIVRRRRRIPKIQYRRRIVRRRRRIPKIQYRNKYFRRYKNKRLKGRHPHKKPSHYTKSVTFAGGQIRKFRFKKRPTKKQYQAAARSYAKKHPELWYH